MSVMGAWEDAEPGVRRRIQVAPPRALDAGTLIDVFTPIREDLLARG